HNACQHAQDHRDPETTLNDDRSDHRAEQENVGHRIGRRVLLFVNRLGWGNRYLLRLFFGGRRRNRIVAGGLFHLGRSRRWTWRSWNLFHVRLEGFFDGGNELRVTLGAANLAADNLIGSTYLGRAVRTVEQDRHASISPPGGTLAVGRRLASKSIGL